MPTDPNQKADDLLSQYAQKRRKQLQPPMSVPPGTRSALQAEVTRTWRTKPVEVPAWFTFLSRNWQRLTIGASATALVLIVAGVWLHFGSSRDLALAQKQQEGLAFFEDPTQRPAPPESSPDGGSLAERVSHFELGNAPAESRIDVAAAANSGPSIADMASNSPRYSLGLARKPIDTASLGAVSTPQIQRALNRPAVSSPLESSAPTTPLLAQASDSAVEHESLKAVAESSSKEASSLAVSPAAPATPAQLLVANSKPTAQPPMPDAFTGAGLTRDSNDKNLATAKSPANLAQSQGTTSTLRFRQIDSTSRLRRNLQSPPKPRVLTTFDFEQIGMNVRVTDADGSVYQGAVQETAPVNSQVNAIAGPNSRAFTPGRSSSPTANDRLAEDRKLNETPQPGQSLGRQVSASSGNRGMDGTQAPVEGFAAGFGNALSNQLIPFRVSGTNRSLKQMVVFTGNFQTSPAQGQGTIGAQGGTAPSSSQFQDRFGGQGATPVLSTLPNQTGNATVIPASQQGIGGGGGGFANSLGRIDGKASVGGKSELKIEALQVPP